jgi:hypothetical protein
VPVQGQHGHGRVREACGHVHQSKPDVPALLRAGEVGAERASGARHCSKYEVVVEHAMNALFKRAAGVEKAKIADLRVRTKQLPSGVPTDLWVDMVITHPTVGRHLNSYFTQP